MNIQERTTEADKAVAKAAFEAGMNGQCLRPGELVQIVVRKEELGGFDKVHRMWLKETAEEQLNIGRRSRNGK